MASRSHIPSIPPSAAVTKYPEITYRAVKCTPRSSSPAHSVFIRYV